MRNKQGKKANPFLERQKEQEQKVVEEKIKVKRKFVDVKTSDIENKQLFVDVDRTRQPASLVFIGHVDVGKSTICGNLMISTGMVDDRHVQALKSEAKKLNRDSWWLAYLLDEDANEKE